MPAYRGGRAEAYKRYYHKKRKQQPLFYIVKQARTRARELGLEFDIVDTELYLPTHCPVLGIELSSGVDWNTDNSYSLDRVDNSKGYTKDNTRVISFLANNLKGANTLQTLSKVKDYIVGHLESSEVLEAHVSSTGEEDIGVTKCSSEERELV